MAISDWLTVTPDTGNSGITTITVSASSLSELSNRAKAIRVTSGNITEYVITKQNISQSVFNVSPSIVVLPITGGSATITITCSASWVLNNPTSWVTFSTVSGTGNTTVIVSATTNDSVNDRSCAISVVSGSEIKTFTITQPHREMLTLTPTTRIVSSGSGSTNVSVSVPTEGTWEILSYPNFITSIYPTSSTQNAVVYINYGTNNTTSVRSGNISFYYNGATQYVSISQTGIDYLEVSPSTLSFSAPGGTDIIAITSSGNWYLSYPSWISGNPSGFGNEVVTVTAATNYGVAPRSGVITASTTNNGIVKYITCTQTAQDFTLSPTSITVSYASGTTSLYVNSYTRWSIESCPSWVTPSIISGTTPQTVTLTYTTNTTPNNRVSNIMVGTDYTYKGATITQTYKDFEVIPSSVIFSTYSASTSSITISVYGNWSIASYPNWITPSQMSGDGTTVITLACSSSTGDRDGIITFNWNNQTYNVAVLQSGNAWWEIKTVSSAITLGGTVPEGLLMSVNDGPKIPYTPGYTVTGNSNTVRFYSSYIWDSACEGGSGINVPEVCSLKIGSDVTSIGRYAFSGQRPYVYGPGLTSVTLSNGLITIGDYAFQGDQGISNITIPDSVRTIGDYAFYDCSMTVKLGSNIETIGAMAFADNAPIKRIILPNTLTTLGGWAFSGCTDVTALTISTGLTVLNDGVFMRCENLTDVTIPDTIQSIGASAFTACSGITSLTIGSGVTAISDYAFLGAGDYATTLNLPTGLTSIGEHAFQGWGKSCNPASRPRLIIPDTVTSIGEYAFQMTGFSGVTIGSGVTVLEDYAFSSNYQAPRLKSLTLPNTITSIGNYCFANQDILSVTIPDSVTEIKNWAFTCNTGLTILNIGTGMTKYGSGAFGDCSGLTTIYLNATSGPTVMYENTFINVPGTGTFYYHAGTDIHMFQTLLPNWTFTTY